MDKKTIQIKYLDFSKNFNGENHFLTRLLRQKYNVEISDKADYAFYSVGGGDHHDFNGIRIFFTGENVVPNFNYCDYAFGFQYLTFEDRYYRLPLWRIYGGDLEKAMKKGVELSDEELLNRKFCATVISNSKQTDGTREAFFEALSKYKQVASGGKWKNNVGGPVPDKLAFQSQYKFVQAYENTLSRGYTTEKLLQAFAANAIPIYYGDPAASQDFNPEAFINAHDFDSLEELVAYVKKIDEDDALYLKMVRAPIFKDGKMPTHLTDEALLNFLSPIFDVPFEKARRRFYAKPYQDIDFNNMKMRDIKATFKAFVKRYLSFKNKEKA